MLAELVLWPHFRIACRFLVELAVLSSPFLCTLFVFFFVWRDLVLVQANRSQAARTLASTIAEKPSTEHGFLCKLDLTDHLRTTPDLTVSTGKLLWSNTTALLRTTQTVMYLSWWVEVPAEDEMSSTFPKRQKTLLPAAVFPLQSLREGSETPSTMSW